MTTYLVTSASAFFPIDYSKLIHQFWLTKPGSGDIWRKVTTAPYLGLIYGLCDGYNTGSITTAEFYPEFCRLLGHPKMSFEEFKQKWNSCVDLTHMARLATMKLTLAQHEVELVIAANTNPLHAEHILLADLAENATGENLDSPAGLLVGCFKASYQVKRMSYGCNVVSVVTSDLLASDSAHQVILNAPPASPWSWTAPSSWLGCWAGQHRTNASMTVKSKHPGRVSILESRITDSVLDDFPWETLDQLSGFNQRKSEALLEQFHVAKRAVPITTARATPMVTTGASSTIAIPAAAPGVITEKLPDDWVAVSSIKPNG